MTRFSTPALPALAGLFPALILLAIFAVLVFGPPPYEVTLAAAVILALSIALILAGLNRMTALIVAMAGSVWPAVGAVNWLLGERAVGAAFVVAVILGAAAVAWAAYKESPRSNGLGPVITGIGRALLFGWSMYLLPVAFSLFFGNLLHLVPEVKDNPSFDETWQEAVLISLIFILWFGVPIGALAGLIGGAFGRPSPPRAGGWPESGTPRP